jgi:phosphoglycerate kinase
MNYKTLNELPEVNGIPVVVRLDFNAPVADGKVVDDYRIVKSLPTINFLREKGAKVIIIAHIEGGTDTLKPVYERLVKDVPATFCEDCIENGAEKIAAMNAGDVMLCENLRLYDGEKKNDPEFAKKLAALGTYYVNDGFSVSHRKHASVVGVPKLLPGFLGLQFQQEVENISKVFNPEHPFVFVLGGAKFDTKLPLVERFLQLADTIIIGGALANDMYKAKGLNVGASLVADSDIDLTAYASNPKIVVPHDVVVLTPEGKQQVKPVTEIKDGEKIFDAGPDSLAHFEKILQSAKTILWNGPLGNYEDGYKEPTLQLARIIANASAVSVLGGGDTLAAIQELKLEDKFTFVSTGGGAMLDFLAQGTLPGLDALKSSK